MRTCIYEMMVENDGYEISVPEGRSEGIWLETLDVKYWKNVDGQQKCIETDISRLVRPTTFDEDTDPWLKKHYREVFQKGVRKNWRVTTVTVHKYFLSAQLENTQSRETEYFQIVPIKPESHLHFNIHAPALQGGDEVYDVALDLHKFRVRAGKAEYACEFAVKEPCEVGMRRLVFQQGVLNEYGDEDYMKVRVIEMR